MHLHDGILCIAPVLRHAVDLGVGAHLEETPVALLAQAIVTAMPSASDVITLFPFGHIFANGHDVADGFMAGDERAKRKSTCQLIESLGETLYCSLHVCDESRGTLSGPTGNVKSRSYKELPNWPCCAFESVWHTPHALTLTRISPRSGSLRSNSSIVNGAPFSLKTAALKVLGRDEEGMALVG